MGKYFGTDGIRGVANADLNAELAYRVGLAAALVLSEEARKRATESNVAPSSTGISSNKPMIVIGKDTRISCDMLEAAITAGMCAAGADVMALGIVPTPTVAFIAAATGADAGVVISASHNPYEHNGIKIFSGSGFKLSDEIEDRIEALIDDTSVTPGKLGGDIGKTIRRSSEYVDAYIAHVRGCMDGDVSNLRVVIDCANGASCRTALQIFDGFKELKLIGNEPDGVNINDGYGSTDMKKLSEAVLAGGYDIGIAFDGDADRCLIIDECGEMVDGDKIMAVCSDALKADGKLKNNGVAVTVMSNHGLNEFAGNHDITLHETKVGDRYVLEKMLELDLAIGGEQSGHVIFLEDSTTGDGQLTAVKFLSALARSGKNVSELASVMRTYPQVLINIPLKQGQKDALEQDSVLADAIREVSEKLGADGRVLVRASGTEPLFRVMTQASQEEIANKYALELVEIIERRAKEVSE